MITVVTRGFAWTYHPLAWFLIASILVWLTREAVCNYAANMARLVTFVGLTLNASVTLANGAMPVVNMPPHFVPASALWMRASSSSHLLGLADNAALWYFSIGDLLLIGGGIVLIVCWFYKKLGGIEMHFMNRLWIEDMGQDLAEYAVLLAVILVIVVGTIRLIGSGANRVFSETGSALNQ